MAQAPKEYQRLPGRGTFVEGNRVLAASRAICSLWLGQDHLLLVNRIGYTETYKRFYFRDIQAVMVRKTAGAMVGNLIMGSLALLLFLWALGITYAAGRLALWIIGGFFVFFTGLNLWRGPTCVTHIKTAVQTELLAPWNRVRTARKGLATLRPRLAQAQGEVPIAELKAQVEERIVRQSQGPGAGSY